jgi:hypothetical protein
VFSADSRVTASNGSYMDNDCKLATFENDVMFTGSGQRQLSEPVGGKQYPWDSHIVAREAIKIGRRSHGSHTLAYSAAHAWADASVHVFQAIVDADPTYFPRYRDTANGAFASKDESGNISVYTITIRVEDNRANPKKAIVVKTIREVAPQGFAVFGYAPIIQEFLNGTSPRAKDTIAKWESTLPRITSEIEFDERLDMQLIQWTIDFANERMVGGNVNSVALNRKGIRWLAQKDYCKSAE